MATVAAPARCSDCQVLVAPKPRIHWRLLTAAVTTVAAFAGMIGVLVFGWWAALAMITVVVSSEAALQLGAPLNVVSESDGTRARRRQMLFLALIAASVVIAGLSEFGWGRN